MFSNTYVTEHGRLLYGSALYPIVFCGWAVSNHDGYHRCQGWFVSTPNGLKRIP